MTKEKIILKGIPASAGIVKGKVKVVGDGKRFFKSKTKIKKIDRLILLFKKITVMIFLLF
jgi:phosphoenolpyruvate synthase/pyruvate phosphate dikinase